MKKSEIEQSIKEIHYRLSKLHENLENQLCELEQNKTEQSAELKNCIEANQRQINILEKRIASLSDELYAYIDRQDQKIIQHIDESSMDLANRVQVLSDHVYDHIGKQLSVRDQRFGQYRREQEQKDWMLKFGYDSIISDLQLSQIETVVPGNRRRLMELKDTHMGETCFVIGNGPSLTAADLDRIRQQGIFSFA